MPRTITPLDEVSDLLSPLGASVLAEHINAYWAAKGGQAGAERYEIPGGGGWGVRSRLVGGLPRAQVLLNTQRTAVGRAGS